MMYNNLDTSPENNDDLKESQCYLCYETVYILLLKL